MTTPPDNLEGPASETMTAMNTCPAPGCTKPVAPWHHAACTDCWQTLPGYLRRALQAHPGDTALRGQITAILRGETGPAPGLSATEPAETAPGHQPVTPKPATARKRAPRKATARQS